MTTAQVTVRVPGLLSRFTAGDARVHVRADTVEEAIGRLLAAIPALEPHLLAGPDELRPHLKLFLNGTELDGLRGAGVRLADGDEIVVLQAVSGGGHSAGLTSS